MFSRPGPGNSNAAQGILVTDVSLARMLREIIRERPTCLSGIRMMQVVMCVGAAVQTVPASPMLWRRSRAFGRPACSSRKP
jgi:hypothetical protein